MQPNGLARSKRKFKNQHQAKKWNITRLAKELERRLGLVRDLEQEHEKLRFEHDLMEELADTFAWLRVQQQAGEQRGDRDEDATAAVAAAAAVDEREARLLAQMPPVARAAAASDDSNNGATRRPGPQTAAVWPPGAPGAPPWREQVAAPIDASSSFGLLRYLLSRPLHPRAAAMTLPELLQEYGLFVRTAAMSLLQLDVALAGPAPADAGDDDDGDDNEAAGAAALRKLQAGFLDHVHLLTSLAMLQRMELLASSSLADWETGEVMSEQDPRLYRRLLRQVPLSREQQRRIALSARVFARLLSAGQAESSALQHELAGSGGDDDGASACGPPDATPSMADALRRLADGDAAEAKLARLRRALVKQYVLRMACSCSILSCLSFAQLARMAVCATPRVFVINLLAAAVVAACQEDEAAAAADDEAASSLLQSASGSGSASTTSASAH